jgi:hypothetical protein
VRASPGFWVATLRALIDQMQLKEAQILRASLVGRATKPDREMAYGADVAALGLERELAYPHVFDHALTQR